MQYEDLCNILREAASESRTVEAFVTFTPDSFDKPYTKKQRTYLFTSDNKAFRPAGGYSIFADCLDSQDIGVRLERYMKAEKGGANGWVIEDCGIVKYQLICVHEHSVEVKGFFDSAEEAKRAVRLEMATCVGCDETELNSYLCENSPDRCGLEPSVAWLNDSRLETKSIRWSIFPIVSNGRDISNLTDSCLPEE